MTPSSDGARRPQLLQSGKDRFDPPREPGLLTCAQPIKPGAEKVGAPRNLRVQEDAARTGQLIEYAPAVARIVGAFSKPLRDEPVQHDALRRSGQTVVRRQRLE